MPWDRIGAVLVINIDSSHKSSLPTRSILPGLPIPESKTIEMSALRILTRLRDPIEAKLTCLATISVSRIAKILQASRYVAQNSSFGSVHVI